MAVDAGWLADPARVFPVTVDPDVYSPSWLTNDTASVDTRRSPVGSYSGDLMSGSPDAAHNTGSLVQFTGINNNPGMRVLTADLKLYQTSSIYSQRR